MQKGFTLAEILITLIVIGILAIITIPALTQAIEKVALKSQIKKTLSLLEQAMEITTADESFNCYIQNYSSLPCTDFWNKFYSNLKIIKTCKGNALADGCIPIYSLSDTNYGCSSFVKNSVNNIDHVRVLIDGTIIIAYYKDTHYRIAVDVNGQKPPNRPGKDIFVLEVNKNLNTGKYTFIPDTGLLSSGGCDKAFNNGIVPDSYFTYISDLYK